MIILLLSHFLFERRFTNCIKARSAIQRLVAFRIGLFHSPEMERSKILVAETIETRETVPRIFLAGLANEDIADI